jgi:hypothetical protein
MAKLNFEFANGTLTATGANTFIHLSATDYAARAVGDGNRIEIYPIFGDKRLRTFDFKYDDITISGADYASVAELVAAFNTFLGGTISYNTKYPENLFSQVIEFDTSVDEQVVPLWIQTVHNGGYITLTTPSTNTGNVHIGEEGVVTTYYYLEPDKSITLEISDLSLIYAQNTTPGDVLMVIGVAKT